MATRFVLLFLLCLTGLLTPLAKAKGDDLPVDYREKVRGALNIPERVNPGSIIRFYEPAYATLKGGASKGDFVWAVRVDFSLANSEGQLPYSITWAVVIFRQGGVADVVGLDDVQWTFASPEPDERKPDKSP